MKRAAIYARYSSDLQNDRSIEDQVALCRTKAIRDGIKVVKVYEDRARSGASMLGRDGILQMLDDAKAGTFDLVLVEALDRISRDQEDTAHVYKRLSFKGIDIVTVHEGRADQIQIGIRGIVSSLYLKDLGDKVRRGAAGNIREGKHAGGKAYGYEPVPGKPGEWAVVDSEAVIVRRIFNEYVNGAPPRAITTRLNAEGIEPPRGRYWAPNTLTGSKSRQNGILANEIYIGGLIYNRTRKIKNPDTGRRIARMNPESEWQRAEAAHLQIVDRETFDAAQAIRQGRSFTKITAYRSPSRHLLSGMLKCGACGGGMSIKGSDRGGTRVICTAFKNTRACGSGRTFYLHHIEDTLLSGLRTELADPKAIRLFLKTYHEERRRLATTSNTERAKLERRIGEAERRIERATAAMLDSDAPVSRFTGIIRDLETEKSKAEAELVALAEPVRVVTLHPTAVERYLDVVNDLAEALAERRGERGAEIADALRELVEQVTIDPETPPGGPINLHVRGRLASLCEAPIFPETRVGGSGGAG